MCLLSENIRPNIMPPPGQGPMSPLPPGLQEGHLVVVAGHCFMGLYDLTCKVIQIFPNGEVSVRYDGGDDPRDAMSSKNDVTLLRCGSLNVERQLSARSRTV